MSSAPTCICPLASVDKGRRIAFARALAPLGGNVQVIVHGLARVGDGLFPVDPWAPLGDVKPESVLALVRQWCLRTSDPSRPQRRVMNRFARTDAGAYEALLFADRDLLGRVVVSGGQVKRSALERTASRLNRAWFEADRAGTCGAPSIFVVGPSGGLKGHDESGEALLSRRPMVSQWLGRAIPHIRTGCVLLRDGMEFRIDPLAGEASLWLIHVRPIPRIRIATDALLSPTQRLIVEYAAAGATVDEIARSVESARETVRTHLRSAYQRLGVSNRVELARALQVD